MQIHLRLRKASGVPARLAGRACNAASKACQAVRRNFAHRCPALVLACFVSSAVATEAVHSGVAGRITLGPNCGGPQREGVECQVPFADIEVRLLRSDGTVAGQTRTSASGDYRIDSKAGVYQLQVMRPNKIIHCPRPEVVVKHKAHAQVDIDCDSGMR